MSTTITCDCGARLRVKTGGRLKCPRCGEVLNVAVPEEQPGFGKRKPGPGPAEGKPFLFRHLPWVVLTGACLAFVILILAIPGVRRVIFLQGEAEQESTSVVENQEKEPANQESAPPEETVSLESSEPGYEVLPPVAAQTPGRRLPKLLLVGSNKNMFQTLEEAVDAAVPGDIIEIRTNRPLVVAAARMGLTTKVKDAPLTIRAGKGYQPVLRAAGGNRPIISIANVDIKILGLHFTKAVTGNYLGTENGHVTFQKCSFTNIPCGNPFKFLGGAVLSLQNSRDQLLKLDMDHCFLRHTNLVDFHGPSVAVTINESGIVGGHYLVDFILDETQSLRIRQTTFQQTYLLGISVQKRWPRIPLSFRMERSIFTLVCAAPYLVVVNVNTEQPSLVVPTDLKEGLRRAFLEFKAGDNVAQFWDNGPVGAWAAYRASMVKDRVFEEFPSLDDTIRLGPRIAQVRHLIWQKGFPPETYKVWASVLPEDLVPTSKGLLAERMNAGLTYGCDVSRLPVPPPVTLQLYDPESVLVLEEFKVARKSKNIYLQGQQLVGLPSWFPGARQPLADAKKAGQWAEFLIPVPQTGTYKVRAYLTRGPRSGIVKLSVNGKVASQDVDLFAAEVSPLPAVALEEHNLAKGNMVLRIETVGKNPNAPKEAYQFGFDKIVLRRVDKK